MQGNPIRLKKTDRHQWSDEVRSMSSERLVNKIDNILRNKHLPIVTPPSNEALLLPNVRRIASSSSSGGYSPSSPSSIPSTTRLDRIILERLNKAELNERKKQASSRQNQDTTNKRPQSHY